MLVSLVIWLAATREVTVLSPLENVSDQIKCGGLNTVGILRPNICIGGIYCSFLFKLKIYLIFAAYRQLVINHVEEFL
jgi:hypothetical protein